MYHYEARVERIVDGDTIEFSVDLGFHMYFREQMRLAHYAAPEIKGPERALGLVAKQKLEELLPTGTIVTIQSQKTEKYGRWLAQVTWGDSTLSEYLIGEGYGIGYDNKRNEKNPTFDPSTPYPLTHDKGKA